jgi:hypothetical protein
MSIELSDELRREVERAGHTPVRLIDPQTKSGFVVLRADEYARLRRVLDAEQIDPSFYEFEEKETPH